MRVKVGDRWYDASETPICVQLTEADQQAIAGMSRGVNPSGKYAAFPEGFGSAQDVRDWMREDAPAER